MEDLNEFSNRLVRDFQDLADDIDSGVANTEYVISKTEEFLEILGVISALHDQDIHNRIRTKLEDVLQWFSRRATIAQQQHRNGPGPGRLALDIPSSVLHSYVDFGLGAQEIAERFGVSKRTIRRRLKESGLRSLFGDVFFLLGSLLRASPSHSDMFSVRVQPSSLSLVHRNTDLYSAVADEELERIVSEIHRSHPNSGYKLMHGFLNARGVRVPSEYHLNSNQV